MSVSNRQDQVQVTNYSGVAVTVDTNTPGFPAATLANGESTTIALARRGRQSAGAQISATVFINGIPTTRQVAVTAGSLVILSTGSPNMSATNSTPLAFVCDEDRLIAYPPAYLDNSYDFVLTVPTPSLRPGQTCAEPAPAPVTPTDESFWEQNRVWIIIIVTLALVAFLIAVLVGFYFLVRKGNTDDVDTYVEVQPTTGTTTTRYVTVD